MPNPKLKGLTTDKLLQRRKMAKALVIIIIIVVILSIVLLLYDFITDGSAEWKLLVPVLGCIAAGLPMYLGIKDIDNEIKSRNS